jgi:hypothetical protein
LLIPVTLAKGTVMGTGAAHSVIISGASDLRERVHPRSHHIQHNKITGFHYAFDRFRLWPHFLNEPQGSSNCRVRCHRKSRGGSTRTILLRSLPALALLTYPCHGWTASIQANRAADFLNTLGVNGHIGSNITQYLDAVGVVADSQYLGVRHWRDSLDAQASWQIAPLQALVNAGITLIGLSLENQSLTVSDHITKAKAWAALGSNALYALEGPNEPNNFPITYNGISTGAAGNPTTLLPAAQFLRDYYTAIKADPVLNPIPVWTVTLGGSEPDNVGLQYLKIPAPLPTGVLMPSGTIYADTANVHIYPMYDHGAQTIDQTADRIIITYDHNFVQTYARLYSGYTEAQADALPKVMTEFGYAATGGTPGGVTVDIPTQAKNILTGFFNAWTKGYHNVDVYDLYDLGDGYGIFSNTGVPKTSGTYIHSQRQSWQIRARPHSVSLLVLTGGDAAQGALGRVAAEADPSIIEKAGEDWPALQ